MRSEEKLPLSKGEISRHITAVMVLWSSVDVPKGSAMCEKEGKREGELLYLSIGARDEI